MIFRTAKSSDIDEIMMVRNSVKENVLSDSTLIPKEMVKEYILNRGRGWVCLIQNQVVGFSIVDLQENNVWALFVIHEVESKGIGKNLHDLMLDWYFSKTKENIWLGTSPGTRAELFYKQSGWKEIGLHGDHEIKFEMSFGDWQRTKI